MNENSKQDAQLGAGNSKLLAREKDKVLFILFFFSFI